MLKGCFGVATINDGQARRWGGTKLVQLPQNDSTKRERERAEGASVYTYMSGYDICCSHGMMCMDAARKKSS
jgi:hypothetical protein